MIIAIAPLIPVFFLIAAGGGIWAFLAGKKKTATTDPNKKLPGAKKPPRGEVVPPVVAPQPFRILQNATPEDPTASAVRLQITSAFGTYKWAAKIAAESGATSDANAEDVLRILALSLPGIEKRQLTEVEVVELPDTQIAQWVDILTDAAPMTWDQLQTTVTAWMVEKGLA